jgi:hypothetical protein
LRPQAIAESDVEWLLEDGFAMRSHAGLRLNITARGCLFLEYLNAALEDVIREMRPQANQKFQELLRTAKASFPDDHLGRCYLVDWTETHIVGDTAPTDFFRNQQPPDRYVGMVRAIHLAEMIINLRFIRGFHKVLAMLKEGDIEASFAELEVGKLLAMNSRQFSFNLPTGIKGSDFDLEIRVGNLLICGDTKCKLEITERTKQTLIDSLRKAQRQFPPDRPSIVFVKLPQTWNPNGLDVSTWQLIQEVCDEFFRGTGRVVSVVFYFSLTIELDGSDAVGYLMAKEMLNPNHRFDKDIDWSVISDVPEPPPHWLNLVRVCA